MLSRRSFSALVGRSGCLLAGAPAFAQDGADLGRRIQSALVKYLDAKRRLGGYLYVFEQEERQLAADGSVASKELNGLRYEEFEGGRALFVTHRNGKAVDDYDRRWQEGRIRDERAASRDPDLADRSAAMTKVKYGVDILKEFAAAFDFAASERTQLRGRATLVVDFEPREGYRPRTAFAKAFTKTRGRAWLDQEDGQLARLESEITDAVTFNPILGSIGRGSKFDFTQMRLGAGTWLPTYERTRVTGRTVLFKTTNEEDIFRYSDYKARR